MSTLSSCWTCEPSSSAKDLTKPTNMITEGNPDVPAEVGSRGGIGQMADAMNQTVV